MKREEHIPLPTISQPEWMRSSDDRVSCGDCMHRQRHMCRALKRTHVPLEIPHRCDHYGR